MSKPLSDYAIIGDTRSCALIAADGCIEWLCWPRHDSPALFTRIVDAPHGGCASVHLDGASATGRRYKGDSAVLETRFACPAGRASVTDFMPVMPPSTRSDSGPDGEAHSRLVRVVECTDGRVVGNLRVRLTPDYGRCAAVPAPDGDGWRVQCGDVVLRVTGSGALSVENNVIRLRVTLEKGERAFLALTLLQETEVEPVETLDDALCVLRRTEDYWNAWCAGMSYDGAYRPIIVRSAVTLKLLTYAPTGAIIAAATTGLPEAVPGNRNYDYRYSWIRDASFTVTAFCNVGLNREAAEYLRFLRDADGTRGQKLKLLYAIDGDVPPEQDLPHLPGWRDVGPVRIGNAADGQQQHDIYGEFMVALHSYLAAVGYEPPPEFSDGLADLIRTLATHAIRCRHEPDQGIWELRSDAAHLQHSKAMLWVCLDRAVKTAEKLGGFDADELRRWRAEADDLRAEYERETWDEARGAYMQAYGSKVLDAAVLRTVLFGALDAQDERTLRTLSAIERELSEGDLVYRYRMSDGLEGDEATFTACAFWRVGVMALAGRTRPAKALFERLLDRCNDVGLFAEEIDAATGEQRGNLPQGFTHMCVINHAVRLQQAIDRYGLIDAPAGRQHERADAVP